MNTYADKTQDHKNQTVTSAVTQNQNSSESSLQFVDKRPEAVTQRKLHELANNSPQISQLRVFQEMANSKDKNIDNQHKQSNPVDTIQLMSNGSDFSRKSLGAKAEEKTALKQWKSGEFFAWDRTNERKDHDHIHVWQTDTDTDKVTIGGHVVTAKGTGKQRAKRNITQHEIVGIKGQNDSWNVTSQKTGERLELEQGSKEVPKEKHEEEELLLRSNLENAVHYLLNTPDDELAAVNKAADKIETKLAKKLKQKEAKKKKKALEDSSSDDESFGFDLFD